MSARMRRIVGAASALACVVACAAASAASPAALEAQERPSVHAVRRGDTLAVYFLAAIPAGRALLLERQVGTEWRAVGDTVRAASTREELVTRLGDKLPDLMRRFNAETEALLWLRLRTDPGAAGLASLFDGDLASALGRSLRDPRVGAGPARHRVRVVGGEGGVFDVPVPSAPERLRAPTIVKVSHVPTSVNLTFRIVASDAIAWLVEGRSSTDTTWRRLSVRPVARSEETDTIATSFPLAHEGIVWQVAVRAIGVGGVPGPLSPVVRYEAFDRSPPRPVLDPRASLDTLDRVHLRWSAAPEPDAAGYHVYRARDEKNSGARVTALPLPVEQLVWQDTSTLEKGQWVYRLSVVDSAGNESVRGNAAPITVPDRTGPVLPGTLTATVLADSAVRLRWSKARANDLREYIVTRQRGDKAAGEGWSRLTRPLSLDTVLVDRGTDGGGLRGVRILRYHLVALDSTGNASAPLDVEVAIPDLVPPAAPASLRAERVAGRALVTWGASASADVARYELRRRTGTADSLLVTFAASERASYDDFTAGPAARQYTIVARDSAGNASPARTATLTVDAGPMLAAPANVIATVRGTGVALRWDALSGAVRYRVERAAARNGEYTEVGAATTNAFVDSTGKAGAWYRVRAVDAGARDGLRSIAAEAAPR